MFLAQCILSWLSQNLCNHPAFFTHIKIHMHRKEESRNIRVIHIEHVWHTVRTNDHPTPEEKPMKWGLVRCHTKCPEYCWPQETTLCSCKWSVLLQDTLLPIRNEHAIPLLFSSSSFFFSSLTWKLKLTDWMQAVQLWRQNDKTHMVIIKGGGGAMVDKIPTHFCLQKFQSREQWERLQAVVELSMSFSPGKQAKL